MQVTFQSDDISCILADDIAWSMVQLQELCFNFSLVLGKRNNASTRRTNVPENDRYSPMGWL